MKKKIVVLLLTFVLVLGLAACGGSSIDSIKSKFKDADYTITTMSDNAKSEIAGCSDGFYARKGNTHVTVMKFSKKDLAEECVQNRGSSFKTSIKKDIYVCTVYDDSSDDPSSDAVQTAIDIFNECF